MKGDAPDWERIADTLIRGIRGGRYKKDDKLPSENAMAKSGSLPTIRCAMEKIGAQREQEVLKILEGTFLNADDPVKRVKVEGVTGN